jgi:hypothetical protein
MRPTRAAPARLSPLRGHKISLELIWLVPNPEAELIWSSIASVSVLLDRCRRRPICGAEGGHQSAHNADNRYGDRHAPALPKIAAATFSAAWVCMPSTTGEEMFSVMFVVV